MGACNETIKSQNPSDKRTSESLNNNQTKKDSIFDKPKFERGVKKRLTTSK